MPQVINGAINAIKLGFETVGVPEKFAQMGADFIVREVVPAVLVEQASRVQRPPITFAALWRSEENPK